ncbi:hypothetical protein ISN44_As08g031140 [Arabidopsis suecica]|uniref:KIB1-4 beta-propeller domain-containing protein n=1 Tax=Arabidopsis suecica TaxID=45249 RepID=A0A8T2BC11_ARASU|nr:hypothetical protein ISN44_As08g031140 [Arabidopsis suecica]
MVCSYWYSGSKQTVPRKSGTPWLMLFPHDGGCLLCNLYEKVVYKTKRDCSGSRFLASCGKWLLMLDSRSRLYIIDVFSGNRIDLPPLESLLSNYSALKRMEDRDKEFEFESTDGSYYSLYADEIKGRLYLWSSQEDNWPMWSGSLRLPSIHLNVSRRVVRVIDFSGQLGFEELTRSHTSPTFSHLGFNCYSSMVVTTAGEFLLVPTTTSESSERVFCFCIYKMDPNADPDDQMPDLVEVDSLGYEVLLLDSSLLTIPLVSNQTLSISVIMTFSLPTATRSTLPISRPLMRWTSVCSIFEPRPSKPSLLSPA